MGPEPERITYGSTSQDPVEQERMNIEQTRSNMSETVDEIQERLSPQNLKEQAKYQVREATVGRVQEGSSGLMETIKENPVPAAMVGVGLGWLVMSARKQKSDSQRYSSGYYQSPYYEGYESGGYESGSTGTTGQARSKVSDATGQAQDKARQGMDQARERASQAGDTAQYQAQRAKGGFERMLNENPLAVGAIAVGVGLAVGLSIPETSKENQVMGQTRDNLAEQAQEKAQDYKEKAQNVAQQAQSAAKEEASNQNITS